MENTSNFTMTMGHILSRRQRSGETSTIPLSSMKKNWKNPVDTNNNTKVLQMNDHLSGHNLSFSSTFADYTLSDVKTCVDVALKLGVNIEGVYVSGGVSGGGCDALLKELGGKPKSRFKFTSNN